MQTQAIRIIWTLVSTANVLIFFITIARISQFVTHASMAQLDLTIAGLDDFTVLPTPK